MPVRLVCPSCSATLSVKDEYAGRAVKCPKCGGVIPASQPGAAASPASSPGAAPKPAPSKAAMPALPPPPAPEPEPEPARSPFEALDEPAKPKAKITGRPTGKPAPKSADADELPDEDEDAKPAKRKDRDEDRDDEKGAKKSKSAKKGDDEDDRPARSKRKGDDEEDDEDRPRGKKRKGDDDDDDGGDRAGGKKKKGGSNVAIILVVVFGMLFLCCGGIGYGVYYVMQQAKKGLEDVADSLTEKNDKVTSANYQKLKPLMTLAEVEAILGKGKPAFIWDLNSAYEADTAANNTRKGELAVKMDAGRLMVWKNKGDYLFVTFHDKPEAGGKLQMKEFVPKAGGAERSGEADDAKFAKDNNLTPAGGAPISVTAEDLSKEFKDNAAAAATKYTGKNLILDGKLEDISQIGSDLEVTLTGAGGVNTVSCALQPATANGIFAISVGQRVKIRCKCVGNVGTIVNTNDGKIETPGPETAVPTTALTMINDYRVEATGDAKYLNKQVSLTVATVERVDGGTLILTPTKPTKGELKKIRVELDPGLKSRFASVKAGSPVKVKGKCEGLDGNEIVIKGAWVAP